MRTVNVSARSKVLNELLKLACKTDVILRSADGTEFVLSRVKGTRSFYVGDDDDFEKEVEMTRKNEELMKFLDERRAKSRGRKGTPLAEVKKQLGF